MKFEAKKLLNYFNIFLSFIYIWSACKALCPFFKLLEVLEVWEWNEVDNIFGLVDFY